ncbi:MAG: AAA family ATPase [Caldisphaeraceae archaeon]|nr:AAA family ATPase [Caldisphaeraceae archaeon]
MKLNIKKLGPVSNSEIELGDVTLLLGPPNTGKSYTLKAIYAKLFPLDDYTLKLVKEKLVEKFATYLEHTSIRLTLDEFRDIFKTIVEMLLIVTLSQTEGMVGSSFEEVFSTLIKKTGLRGTIERQEDLLIVNIEAPSVSIPININFIKQTTQELLYDFITEIIPVEDANSVTFEPIELSTAEMSFVEEAREHEVLISTRQLLLLFEELLNYIREHHKEIISFSTARSLLAYLARSGITWGARTSIKPSIDRIELSSTITFKLRLRANASMSERPHIGIKLDYIERIVDDMFEKDRMSDPRLMHSIAKVIRIFANSLSDSLSEAILYESLRESFRSHLGLNDLRFIPFGRSIFVLGLESASREPFTRSEFLHRFVREFYSSTIASYVYWASKGRGRLLEDKLSEKQATLLKVSTPLLEGKLSTDAARRLLYRDWRGSTVDFQLSSALVEEVSGLVFTLLSVDDNALVLIEEPEAQLHPGAQIVMALFLASLPSLCGCQVVATTHSDLLAITLSQLVVQKPGKEWIKGLLEKLLPHVKGDIDALAEATAEAVGNLDLRVYEFTRKGRVKPVKPEDVLGREVPGISRVIDELTDWAFRLASYRASRETG